MCSYLHDPQDEAPVCHCSSCGGEVYRGETMFEWDSNPVCDECFKGKVSAWVNAFPTQVANALCLEIFPNVGG